MAKDKTTIKDKIKQIFTWREPVSGAGNILSSALPTGTDANWVPDQTMVRAIEPYGNKKPNKLYDRTTGYSQIQNLSHEFTMQKVQGAFRSAENGDVRMLFAYYRDFFLGTGIVVTELGKRKLSTISVPYTILPASKSPDDVKAAKIIEQLLTRCPTFRSSLVHMMNAIVYPIAVIEKAFSQIDESYGTNEFNLKYRIKELHAVDYNMITYRLPYIPQSTGHTNIIGNNVLQQGQTSVVYESVGRPEDVIYDPDSWEPDLRFWSVLPNGTIIQAPSLMISPDPDRHIIYRCNLLHGIARENFGGLGKSLLFLAIMSQLGLDVFLRCLQKYGMPLIITKVDNTQVDTVNAIAETFGNLNIVNAIMVNKDAQVQIEEMNYSGAADAHSKFVEFINDQISLLISGQTLSSHAKSTGLGSGVANLQGAVREDIIQYDRLCLSDSLKHGLFKQLLEINDIKGECPTIQWGAGNSPSDNLTLSDTINNLKLAGLELDDESIEQLSEKFGFKLQRTGLTDSANIDPITSQQEDKPDPDNNDQE